MSIVEIIRVWSDLLGSSRCESGGGLHAGSPASPPEIAKRFVAESGFHWHTGQPRLTLPRRTTGRRFAMHAHLDALNSRFDHPLNKLICPFKFGLRKCAVESGRMSRFRPYLRVKTSKVLASCSAIGPRPRWRLDDASYNFPPRD